MKKRLTLAILTFFTFCFSLFTCYAQTWQQMMDSTKFYQEKQDFQSALQWAQKALPQSEKEFGKLDTNYAATLSSIVDLFYYNGNLDSTIYYQQIYLELWRVLFKGDHSSLANSINNMAFLYKKRGRYTEAEPLYKEALEMFRRLYKGDHPDLANCINNMAVFYYDRGRYTEAEPLFKEALEIYRRLFKGIHPGLAMTINNMAEFYDYRGKYAEAEPLYKEALEMYRSIFKTDHPNLALSINNMASFYNGRGRYKEAEPLFKEALEMSRRLFKSDHPNLAGIMDNMAMFYNSLDKYAEAEPLYKEALEMYRKLFKDDHPDLAQSINSMAYFYNGRGRYTEAEPLFKEALAMRRRLFKNDHLDLAKSINNMAMLYNNRGIYVEAEPLYKEALEMFRRLFKTDHSDLAKSINSIAVFYFDHHRYTEAEPLYLEALQVNQNMLNNYFPSLSEKEKKQFWATVSSDFESFNSFAIKRVKDNPAITGNLYDIQLYSKGLLFNSSSRIRSRVMNSKDDSLISNYKHWLDLKEYILKCWSKTSKQLEKEKINLDSLENLANDYEKAISKKSELYAKNYEKKKISWKLIPGVLQPGEAAIEILRFRLKEGRRFTDTVYYAALIVTEQTTDYPELVVLENGNDLENKCYSRYMKCMRNMAQDKESFNDYWAKIYEKIKGYKRIYLSCDGIYNKINPETFLMPDGKYLMQEQEILQVNSTKDLISGYFRKQTETNIYNSAELFGNPTFDLPLATLKEKEKKYEMAIATEEQNIQPESDRGLTLKALPGTEKEVSDIDNFLKSKNWVVKSYIKDEAIKAAIKSVHSPRVLHIATHGLFLSDIKKDSSLTFGMETKRMVENPLLRSGLFFAGAANNKDSSNFVPTGEDNGFLTSYEAMNLDLENTELVVLSACETGLGEIQNGEGVFGLRRAFQQAGAKTVVMTLWKVFDSPTQEMMTKFYANWVTGMTKREAFSKAKQDIQSKYKDPYYWGAFVMVGE